VSWLQLAVDGNAVGGVFGTATKVGGSVGGLSLLGTSNPSGFQDDTTIDPDQLVIEIFLGVSYTYTGYRFLTWTGDSGGDPSSWTFEGRVGSEV